MRPHILVLTALALAAAVALAGCAFDQMAMTEDDARSVTVQPVDVTPPPITRYANENRGEFARLEDDNRRATPTKPVGYFGPERGESLNRTGVRRSRPEDLE